ncbi:hypothetical protein, partial [Chromobacterium amazonense]|uniref:hypothetical protein n=1 Tax=Chromobacterium amazonense TaxID=1382803 RepID=UPI0031F6D5D9
MKYKFKQSKPIPKIKLKSTQNPTSAFQVKILSLAKSTSKQAKLLIFLHNSINPKIMNPFIYKYKPQSLNQILVPKSN